MRSLSQWHYMAGRHLYEAARASHRYCLFKILVVVSVAAVELTWTVVTYTASATTVIYLIGSIRNYCRYGKNHYLHTYIRMYTVDNIML